MREPEQEVEEQVRVRQFVQGLPRRAERGPELVQQQERAELQLELGLVLQPGQVPQPEQAELLQEQVPKPVLQPGPGLVPEQEQPQERQGQPVAPWQKPRMQPSKQ